MPDAANLMPTAFNLMPDAVILMRDSRTSAPMADGRDEPATLAGSVTAQPAIATVIVCGH
ncbi:hypothetical protein [Rhodococcus jostii]|uniref:hypothetical protein n=1 Tax=Rhodococcus jostii TaxID=132919 RepID=UPI0036585AB0